MINYAYEYLFKQDSVDKQINIEYSNGSITNTEIVQNTFKITESLCSETQLKFGCCEASKVEFTVGYGEVPLSNETLTISISPDGEEALQLGVYDVISDTPTADRKRRNIVAYDKMYQIINAEVIEWYNALFPTPDTVKTIKQIRDSFFAYLGIEQESISLPLDNLQINKTITADSLSGKDVITAICEACLGFGHITREGRFKYIGLQPIGETLYPDEELYPADDLYPKEGTVDEEIGVNGNYISATYEDYYTDLIDKFQIRTEENDIGYITGTGTNAYIIEGNFLLFGKTSQELASIYANALSYLGTLYFTPANIVAQGNPCLEVGDRIRLHTRYATIDTYILQRTMTGIQSLRDNYVATSPKERSEQVNSVNHSLLALNGKTNVLNRTIEETQSIITDDILSPTNPLSLQSQITQNASEIETIVRQLYGNCEYYEREGAPTLLNYPAWDFCSNIPCNDTVATTDDLGFVYTSTDYFNHLNALVYDTQNNKVYRFVYNSSTLNYEWNDITDTETAQILEKITRVSQTVEGLTSTVTATELEVENHEFRIRKNESEISQQADKIELKVSKDDVVSSINQSAEEISIDANRINLNGAVTSNNNVEIGVDGKIHINDGEIINVTNTDRIRINDTIDLQSYSDVGGYWYDNLKITPLASGSIDFYYDNGFWGGKVYGDSVVGGVAIQTTEYGAFSVLISGTRKMLIAHDYIHGQTTQVYGNLEGLWYGTLQSPSDRDLKKNIKDINKALIDIVGDIPLKQFEFKSNEGVVEIGIIAQDLAEKLEKQGLTDYGIVSTFMQDGKEYKAVNYTEFLIARNQYLEQRIDDLESRIERLENLMKGENQ